MSQSEEALLQLENQLIRVAQRLRMLQTENMGLKEEIQTLRKELEDARKENTTKDRQIKRLNQDRLRIRTGVEQIVQKMDALEEPVG